MAKKSKPTSGSQWAQNINSKDTIDYNSLDLLSERPDGVILTPQEASLINLLNQSPISTFKAREVGKHTPSSRIDNLGKKENQHFTPIASKTKNVIMFLYNHNLLPFGFTLRLFNLFRLRGA